MASGGDSQLRPVVVVGAGPVGMTCALALRSHGLPVTLLEAGDEGRERPGSRAIFYHRQTLERWEQICPGLGWEIARSGLVWSTKRTYWGERQVFERSYPPPDPTVLPHSTNLAQFDVEQLLFARCRAAGVEVAFSSEVCRLEVATDAVRLTTKQGETLQAAYVVAADGSRSAVRSLAGIVLEGETSENAFVIVDVAHLDGVARQLERRYYYRHPAVQERNVLLVPFAGGWRADLQLRVSDDPAQFNDGTGVRDWIARILGELHAENISWVSTYYFKQVVASSFVDPLARVLLVGEAAHLFAPFGARGLNSGVPDALTAAQAVARAIGATGQEDARRQITAFAEARRCAALYNRDAAALALRHMRGEAISTRLKRRGAAALAGLGVRAGAWLDSAPFGPRAAARGSSELY